MVNLVLELAARDPDLLGIDDDDVVTGVDMGRINGLVLAPQAVRQGRSQPAQGLALGIDDIPVAADRLWLGRI